MGLTVLFVVVAVVGGTLAAVLILAAHRWRSSGRSHDAFADGRGAGPLDVINISAIRVAGIGGLGLVAVAMATAWSIPRIGQAVGLGAALGAAFAVLLILWRRRRGPMPTSGRAMGANTTLSIDHPVRSGNAGTAEPSGEIEKAQKHAVV